MPQIITTNTTWEPGSVYSLVSDLQIASGVTLTIEAGTEINGNGHTIEVYGSLDVAGASGSDVRISNTSITEGNNYSTPASIDVNYATLLDGSFMAATGNAVYGQFDLTNSIIDGQRPMYIWYPTGNVLIQGNYFLDTGGLSIGTSGSVDVSIDHNTFVGWTANLYSSAAIENWASYSPSETTVTNNNFLSVGKIALELPPGYSDAAMTSSGNYFGTVDPNVIAEMIYDKNIDLNSAAVIPNASVQSNPVQNAGQPPVTLPNVSSSLTAISETTLQNALDALSGSASIPNVVISPTGTTTISAYPGILNAIVVENATASQLISLPSGYDAAYLENVNNETLDDTNGGSVLVGVAPNSTLLGTINDTLIGGNAGATLIAGAGAETLVGGTGSNMIELGTGNDSVIAQGLDTIIGSTGPSMVDESGSALYFGGSSPVNFTATGGGAQTLIGGGSETVTAGASPILLFGGPGPLTFLAGSGSNTIVGGVGSATSISGGTAPLLYFGNGASTYTPGSATDTVLGYTGSLTAMGGANGTLFFTGTAGNNVVSSGQGSSTVIGFGSHDLLSAVGLGNDLIAASGSSTTIDGSLSMGSNTFFGFGDGDLVKGGAGPTAVEVALGSDTLIAGTGPTVFDILASGSARLEEIADFDVSRDFVELSGYGSNAASAAFETAMVSGGNTSVNLSDGTQIVFLGVTNLVASSLL